MKPTNIKRLADIAPAPAISVAPHTPVGAVLAQLAGAQVSSVIVTDAGQAVGIFTERDALRLVALGRDRSAEAIAAVMSPDPVTCRADCSCMEGYWLLARHGIRRLAVTDDNGRLIGIVSRHDLLKDLADSDTSLLVEDLSQQHAAEMRFRRIFEAMPVAAVLIRLGDQCCLDVNEAALALSGYRRDAVVGRTAADLPLWVEGSARAGFFRTLGAGDPVRGLQAHVRGAAGTDLTVSLSGEPIEIDGEPCAVVLALDITRVNAQQDVIQRQNELFTAVFEAIPDAFGITNTERELVMVNPAFERVFGYSAAELIGRRTEHLCATPDGFQKAGAERCHAAADKSLEPYLVDYRRKDGRVFPGETVGTVIRDLGGECLGYLELIRDATDMRAVRRELERNEAQLHSIFDHANVGIMLLTGYRILARGNRRLAEILGYDSPAQMQGISMQQLHLSQERFVEFGRNHYERLRQREELHIEYQLRRRDGSAVWCLLSGAATDPSVPADLAQGVIWTVDDISDLKAKEAALAAANEALREAQELFTSGPTMLFRWRPGPRWPVAYCSANTLSRLGVNADELMSGAVDFASLMHPTDLTRVNAEVADHVKRGSDRFEQEYRLRGAGGDWRYVLAVIYARRDGSGAFTGYLGYLVDITDQRAREALTRSEAQLKQAQQVAQIGSWELVCTTRELTWSTQVYRIFELDPAQFVPSYERFLGCVHPADRARVAAAYERSVQKRAPYDVVHRLLMSDGRIKYVQERASTDYDHAGTPLRSVGTVHDVTAREAAMQALRASEDRYRSMFQSAQQAMFLLDDTGDIVQVNDAGCELLGYPDPATLIGSSPGKRSPVRQPRGTRSAAEFHRRICSALRAGSARFEWTFAHRDGHEIPADVTLIAVTLPDAGAVLCTAYDLSDRLRAAELEGRATAVFENTTEGIMITDADNRILAVNPSFCRITGYTEAEVLGKAPTLLQSGKQTRDFYAHMWQQINATGHWSGEVWNRRKDGELFVEWLSISTVRDGEGRVQNYIAVFSDITQARKSEQELDFLTHYDPTTGLPNPNLLRSRLAQLFRHLPQGQVVGLLCLNLDGFQRIVTRYGYRAGDALLGVVAGVLTDDEPASSTATRLGADSFIIAAQAAGTDALAHLALDFQKRLRAGLTVEAIGSISLSCCVGIALYPTDADQAGLLIRHAESALRSAKGKGPGSLAYYQPQMTAVANRRLELEQALRQALEHREFVLHYQPKLNLQTAAIDAAEALIRWQRADGALVPPGEFIPVIEYTDMVDALGRWVVDEAVRAMARWDHAGLPSIDLSINASASFITSGRLGDHIRGVLDTHGIEPQRLEVEVLEGVLIDDPARAARELNRLHDLGVAIALDDFGTGYSNLGYLKRFPFTSLKIDRSFVRDLVSDPGDLAIVRSTITMARDLGIRTVAEGVETDEQIQLLVDLGCDVIQGYGIGQPLPEASFRLLLKRAQPGCVRDDLRRHTTRPVLVVTGAEDDRKRLQSQLEQLGHDVLPAAAAEQALALLGQRNVSIVLADRTLPDQDGIAFLEHVQRTHPHTVRGMLIPALDAEVVVQAIHRAGVARFIQRPWSPAELAEAVAACIERAGGRS